MSLWDSKYKALAVAELDNDYSSLSKGIVDDSEREFLNFFRDAEIAIAQLNFAHRIQLVSDADYKERLDKLNKLTLDNLNKERKEIFREQVINPNDDFTTARERLFKTREVESSVLEGWKKEIAKSKAQAEVDKKTSASDTEDKHLHIEKE